MIDKVWFYPPRREDEEITNKVSNWIEKNSLICQYVIDSEVYESYIFIVIEDHVIPVEGLMIDYIRDNWREVVFKKTQCEFKPGELVITKNLICRSPWFITTFSHITTDGKFFCGDGRIHIECYPLKGNEELVGTIK